MKCHRNYLYPALALAALAPRAWAEKEVIIRRIDADGPHRALSHKVDGKVENVTYLGVETAPMNRTLGAQLGLPREVGLVVINVMEKSPAASLLKEDDVLTKLDDQILIDTHQFGVLIRGKKEGDEVNLTLVRGGKEMSVKAKLAVHEVPRMANAFYFQNGGPGGANWQAMMPPEAGPGLTWEYKLPGMGPNEARDVLHMIEHERGSFMTGPGVRILGRAGKGSTIVDLPQSNISYSDDEGSIEIKMDDDKRNVTVKNAKGEVAFAGPINTEEERRKLPPEIKKRLEKLDADSISFEVGDDFKPDVVPLPPEPAGTKINYSSRQDSGRDAPRPSGPL